MNPTLVFTTGLLDSLWLKTFNDVLNDHLVPMIQ